MAASSEPGPVRRRRAWSWRRLGALSWALARFAVMAKTVAEGRALETIPIMEYVWERTNRVQVNEELL